MEDLADEVLLLIFSRLNSNTLAAVARASKRWRALSLDLDVVRSVQYKLNAHNVDDNCLERFVEARPHVRSLSVSGCFARAKRQQERQLSGETLRTSLARLSDLRVLDVSQSPAFDDACLSVVAKSCPQLVSLNIDACPAVTFEPVIREFEGAPWLPNVARLSMRNCHRVSLPSIRWFLESHPMLDKLNLRGLIAVRDEIVASLVKCPRIKSLTLRGTNIAGQWETVLGGTAVLSNMRFLYLNGLRLRDEALASVLNMCPDLRVLNVTACLDLTDASLAAVARLCPAMEELQLGGCVRVTDEGVCAVAAACPNLLSLSLRGVSRITDSSLFALASSCQRLDFLSLRECSNVTDAGVVAVCRACPRLNQLYLYGCSLVTDACLAEMPLCATDVQLCCGPRISGAGIEVLAERCTRLRLLNVGGATNVDDRGLYALARHCPELEYFHCGGCPVTADAIRALRERYGARTRISTSAVRGDPE